MHYFNFCTNKEYPMEKTFLEKLFYHDLPGKLHREDGIDYLPEDHGPFYICTNSARYVVSLVGGLVVGFPEGENLSSHKEFVDGHDFALVRGRYLVDIWGHFYAGVLKHSVVDLLCPDHVRQILPFYGNMSAWKVLVEKENPQDSLHLATQYWRPFFLTDFSPSVRKHLSLSLKSSLFMQSGKSRSSPVVRKAR